MLLNEICNIFFDYVTYNENYFEFFSKSYLNTRPFLNVTGAAGSLVNYFKLSSPYGCKVTGTLVKPY